MAATVMNGNSNNEGNASNPPIPSSSRQQSKPPFNTKNTDGNRKQVNSSDSGRRNTPQKAWTSGTNPITQRSNTPAQQNGVGNRIKTGQSKPTINQETNTPDKYGNDRLLFLLANMMGYPASVSLKTGDAFAGIFFGATMEGSESSYLLKMVHQTKNRSEANGVKEGFEDYAGVGDDHSMSFDIKDVIDLAVEGIVFNHPNKLPTVSSVGFRTDADISGNLTLRERALQKWEPSSDSAVDFSLEQNEGTWDQFRANEEKFGLTSDYAEEIYTTTIDKSNPLYPQREAAAQRIAQEIERSSAENSHVREERGITNDDDETNEEVKYSGVQRQATNYPPLQTSQTNKYMPPARRLPTSRSSMASAPVDPAIISLQVARPESGLRDRTSETTNLTKHAPQKPNGADARPVEALTHDGREVITATSRPAVTIRVPIAGFSATANFLATSRPPVTMKVPIAGSSATANVESELLDSFRQFSNFEKMRYSDRKRERVSLDKAIKLKDLKNFSTNFKLLTPVPKDLVPILAKDKSKQEEIMEKAQRNSQSSTAATPKLATTSGDQKPPRPLAEAKYEGQKATAASAIVPNPMEQPEVPTRQAYPPQGPQATLPPRDRSNVTAQSPKTGQGMLSHRLENNHRLYKGGMPVTVPIPVPIQSASKGTAKPTITPAPTSASQNTNSVRTPTSAASAKQFNVKASEFRPNPAASTFKPVGNPSATSSPRATPNARPASRAPSPSAFFGTKRPVPPSQRLSIHENFNPLKRLKEKAQEEGRSKDYASNGGIPPAYATPPTWRLDKDEDLTSYKSIFENVTPVQNKASPQQASPVNPPLPHQHQLPLHLQNGAYGQLQPPQQPPYPIPHQNHHYPSGPHHYDDHRMHLPTQSSSVYPSPRLQSSNVAYPSPMAQSAQLAYGQPIPQYVLGPNGPHTAHFRPFPAAHQLVAGQGPQLAAPMMVQQSSQGNFVSSHNMSVPFNPQVPMYPPGQPPAYGGQTQPPSGYPSPGRGAPMMMHQGSHQGQQPQMYATPGQYGPPVYAQQPPPHMMPMRNYSSPQPQYSHSPQQQHHFPAQNNRVQSHNYGQPGNQHMAAQNTTVPTVALDGGEEAK